jgi:hypothetical protein
LPNYGAIMHIVKHPAKLFDMLSALSATAAFSWSESTGQVVGQSRQLYLSATDLLARAHVTIAARGGRAVAKPQRDRPRPLKAFG